MDDKYIAISAEYLKELEDKAKDAEYTKGYSHGYRDAIELIIPIIRLVVYNVLPAKEGE